MYDPHESRFVTVPETLTHSQCDWARFQEGETISVKGIPMRVHEIGESRLILKPIKP
jgi:hypothetical protein